MGAALKRKPNELTISRIYDAPVKAVWEAWTDPQKAALWWGPRGFRITTHSKDLKVGGTWHYTMHGPDGVDYPNKTKYFEVEPMKKLVYDHGGNDLQDPLFRVTVTFEEVKGKTRMEMTMAMKSAEAAQETKKFIKAASGNSTWDRLAEYLEKQDTGKEKFVINRVFEAPMATVFKMFSEPKHLAKWLAPTGMSMEFLRADIRPGGESFYFMSGQGMKMYGKAKYLEIRPQDFMKYTQEFCDENENQSRHPMAPTWPALMQTTLQLTQETPNETRVTITWEVVGDATAEEMNTFIAGRAGMTQGWTGSFDKLEDYLATQK
jgi:uncharacterized protein YndB with AHSA1/START domain